MTRCLGGLGQSNWQPVQVIRPPNLKWCPKLIGGGIVEVAPAGIPVAAKETYHYVLSPTAFALGGLLVVVHRLGLEAHCGDSQERRPRSAS